MFITENGQSKVSRSGFLARCESTAECRTRTEWTRGKDENYSWNELQKVLRKLGKELDKGGQAGGQWRLQPNCMDTCELQCKTIIKHERKWSQIQLCSSRTDKCQGK